MPTKLGFQLHNGTEKNTPTALERLALLRPKVLLVQDAPDLLSHAYDVIGAGPVYIHRQDVADNLTSFINLFGDIQKAAEGFLTQIETAIRSVRWAYHCTPPSQGITTQQALFDALVVKLAAERFNTRLCIGNFLTSTPTPSQWAIYRPALEAAERYNAIIGLQEFYPILPYVGYGPNANIPDLVGNTPRRLQNEIAYPQGYQGVGQLVGYYRHLRDYCRQQKLPVRIVITDSGAGRVLQWLDRFRPNLGYWRTLAPVWQQFGIRNTEAQYFQDITWLDQHVYKNDPEVIGTCLFAWNTTPVAAQAEIGSARSFLDRLQLYATTAQQDQPLGFEVLPLTPPQEYRVEATRLRIRTFPSMNTKFIANYDYGEKFTATHYTFNDGWLWLKHPVGWSAYAPLVHGQPDYDEKYLTGKLITTPRQDSAVNNFVGTIEEVRSFMRAQGDNLFYIAINSNPPPEGARRFQVTVFPANQGRRIIDQLHPQPGDPLMTPGAKKKLRDAGQT